MIQIIRECLTSNNWNERTEINGLLRSLSFALYTTLPTSTKLKASLNFKSFKSH